MKSFQDRLFKDFDVKKVKNEDGSVKNVYVYRGKYRAWVLSDEERDRYRRVYLSAGIVLAVLFVWAAFQRVPVNASKIAGGVTLLAFVALMALEIGLVQFFRTKKVMYQRDCEELQRLLLWSSMLYFLLQALDVCAGILFFVRNGVTVLSVLVLLANVVSAGLSLVIFLMQHRLQSREITDQKIIERSTI